MDFPWHALLSWLADDDLRGTCVLCQADHEGQRKWFCRLSCKKGTSIQYGSDPAAVLQAALNEVPGGFT
jgi:hypothetical protein